MADYPRAPVDITHTTLSVAFLGIHAVAAFWVVSPFLTSILWATIISVAIWPLLVRLQAALGGRRGLAVTIVTIAILLVVFVPVTLAIITIARNAQEVTTELSQVEGVALPGPPAWLAGIPGAGERMSAAWARFVSLNRQQRLAELTPYAQGALQWFAAQAGSVGMMLLQFLLATIITAIMLTNGETVREGLLLFARRLAGQHGHDAAVLAARAIRGVVLGVVLTALIQAAIAGTGLVIAGIPAAGLLTAVMLFLCLAQIGPILVMLPAVIWVYWSGDALMGTVLLVITVVAGGLDNVIRPWLIRRGANLPLVLIFAGVIGGLLAFGVIGLFIGPVVLTVAYTLLAAWVSEKRAERAPEDMVVNARL
jgi:predicted PurR-regulated permease PerM